MVGVLVVVTINPNLKSFSGSNVAVFESVTCMQSLRFPSLHLSSISLESAPLTSNPLILPFASSIWLKLFDDI